MLTGLLNFLNRAIVPGRVFTRRMSSKLCITDKKGRKLKQYHHVSLNSEFKCDCETWETFLINADKRILCRPFIDLAKFRTAHELCFYTDASGKIGYGCFFDGRRAYGLWKPEMLKNLNPSIEFLELFA